MQYHSEMLKKINVLSAEFTELYAVARPIEDELAS
jgi:hypothetical protein